MKLTENRFSRGASARRWLLGAWAVVAWTSFVRAQVGTVTHSDDFEAYELGPLSRLSSGYTPTNTDFRKVTVVGSTDPTGEETRALKLEGTYRGEEGILQSVSVQSVYRVTADVKIERFSNAHGLPAIYTWTQAGFAVSSSRAPKFWNTVAIFASGINHQWHLITGGGNNANNWIARAMGAAELDRWYRISLTVDRTTGTAKATVIDLEEGENGGTVVGELEIQESWFERQRFDRVIVSQGEGGRSNSTTQGIAMVDNLTFTDGPRPTACFTLEAEGATAPTRIDFDAGCSSTPDGTAITSYEWRFDDETTADGSAVSHTFAAPGRYLVRLSVANDQGLADETVQEIVVACPSGDISPWTSSDVGTPAVPGAARFRDDSGQPVLSVCASGKALGGTADRFHFVHREFSGDASFSVQIRSVEAGANGRMVGAMFRESLAPGARYAAMDLKRRTFSDRYYFHWRSDENERTRSSRGPEALELPNVWVRIERQGDELIGSVSNDGALWDEVERITLPGLAEKVYGGVMVIGGELGEGQSFESVRAELGDPDLAGLSVVEGSFIRGDSNGDGRPDLSDAVLTLNYLFGGGIVLPCLESADSNDSGIVDVSDPVHLLGYLFNGGSEPPAPFSECGVDTTPDELNCEVSAAPCA